MGKLKSLWPWIAAIAGVVLIGNSGFVIYDALNMDTSNISVLLQGLGSLFAGGGSSYLAYRGRDAFTLGRSSTYDADMASIKQLAKSCRDYEEAAEALRTISGIALQKELEPDAE